jgi:two-component system, cell cycle sensor histidine kinase and response regulator CckA
VLGLALAYAATARIGLAVAVQPHVTLFWPPTGIAVAVLFRAGLQYWPGVYLGMVLANAEYLPSLLPFAIAAGNTLGPVLAAAALRWFRFERSLARVEDLILLVGVGGLAGMLVTSTFGVAILSIAEVLPSEAMIRTWMAWYLGDIAGVLIVAPIILTANRGMFQRIHRKDVAVAVGWLIVTTVVSIIVFASMLPLPARTPAVFLPFLVILVAGILQPVQLGMLHALILSLAVAIGTAAGMGPFGRYPDLETRILMAGSAMTTVALVVLLLTTLLAQRDRVTSRLAAVAAEYEALVEDNPALICRFAPDGTIRYANETLERFLGLPFDGLIGRSVFEFTRTADQLAFQAKLAERKELPLFEFTHDTPTGERIVRWAARRVRLPDVSLHEFHSVGLDVTAERQADRNRLTLEKKLVESQRLEALGVLAGGVAHDFNNILTGILGHTEFAASTLPADHPARAHLVTAAAGATRAGALTRQLLAYAGKGQFLSRPISLNELIHQNADLLRMTVSKKVEVRLELGEDIPPITADESQLQQVVMNLVINGGEAIGDATGVVTLKTSARDIGADEAQISSPGGVLAAGRYVELTVTDTGCGMGEETRAKLFDPFFTTKFAGRGLGLSAVLGIVRAHNGAIRVDSRTGAGSRFSVLLPADSKITRADIVGFSPLPTENEHPASGSMGVALVVDDEATVRRLGALMLQQMGYEVIQAENGRQAVDVFALHADRIRVILLDLTMPVMDGIEAITLIRRSRPDIPVVLCSGYTDESLPAWLAHSSTTAFLRKPYLRGELRTAIDAVIEG